MTQEELDKIVEQHRHWLKEDCEGWEDMKADLSMKNLSVVQYAYELDININFCPMCGRKLKEADDGND